MLDFSITQVACRERSPATTVAWLVEKGLKIEYANLIVDAVNNVPQDVQAALTTRLLMADQLMRLEKHLDGIEKALKKPKKSKGKS